MNRIERLVQNLKMQPHPEGGFFAETYRSELRTDVPWTTDPSNPQRNICTGIYFLIPAGQFSAFHRIQSDEMWHHYEGDSVRIHEIGGQGARATVVGPAADPLRYQYVVPAGQWFASECEPGEFGYCLVGCTVSPGFDFSDFELARRQELMGSYPEHGALIERLTRI